jgi:RNA polymerase sigma factor (sigma-70 family)
LPKSSSFAGEFSRTAAVLNRRAIFGAVSEVPASMPPKEKGATTAAFPSDLAGRFHGPLLVFFARRTRDHALAQDLTQETLLRVFAAQRLTRVEHPESYVFTVAMNLLRDRKRASLRTDPPVFIPIDDAVASELEQQLMEDLSPERVLLSEESLNDVLRTLSELGERTRDIFILFRLERMKQKDIAALFGIAQSTVEKHVMRAAMHLAERYGGLETP